jgi:hypothetical protein
MTHEQRVRLVREILEQFMNDELDEAGALRAIDYVRDSPAPYEHVALAVRFHATGRDDGPQPKA